MKTQTKMVIKAHIIRCASYLLLLVAGTVMAFFGPQSPTKVLPRTLSFAKRVAYQRAIEDVYWRHRIWPKENPNPKPSLDAVMSQAQLEKKVEDYLFNSQAVERYYKQPLSAGQLQGEMDRMARDTKQPEVLRELFAALGNDSFVIAECLARPVLTERLIADLSAQHQTGRFESLRTAELHMPKKVAAIDSIAKAVQVNRPYQLPIIAGPLGGCIDDTWTPTSITNAPDARNNHAAVWTGTEMIIWGGGDGGSLLVTGGRYNPSTDSWTPTSTVNAPDGRIGHRAVWTGTEMIVWGGLTECCPIVYLNTGSRYNPSTDIWTATTTTGAPDGRSDHTVVWTGSEMIVWGGWNGSNGLRTGSRYNPNTDSWTDTSTTNAPTARYEHTAVWTGSEMIVWGGTDGFTSVNTGRRYNPISDTWTATTTTGAPTARGNHTAVWTGTEMIVWGGGLNTGGRYDANTDGWMPTSITNAPSARTFNKAVWIGSEMIVWGGLFVDINGLHYLNTGGRYNPTEDSWTATTTADAPDGRAADAAVWTGNEMIVWGGSNDSGFLNTGGRYCAESRPIPTPTPTPTAGPFTLSAQKKIVHTINTVRLTWSGATSANIDVYRNNVVVATTANDGVYDDSTGDTGEAEYMYMVCEAGTQTCSNEVLVRFAQNGQSATWSMNPVSGDWNNPLNWTPNTVPHGPGGTATFDVSNITDISLSDAIEVGAIVFNAGASPFRILCPMELIISGAGITNNSGVTQNFISNRPFVPIRFIHAATAGSETVFKNQGGDIEFEHSASAGSATFVTIGHAGLTRFSDNATCDNATFINEDGGTTFPRNGANATFINNGVGGTTFFGISGERAGNATLIANDGGSEAGGLIVFNDGSHGDTARVEIFGNGLLDLSQSFAGTTLGSIEGDGIIELGDWVLTVGTNDLSTVFGGLIKDEVSEGGAGRLEKVDRGTLTLSSANTYEGGTVIWGGGMMVNNRTGSATGRGPVDVNTGTLGGSGIIAGAVTIGSGSGTGAFLAPSGGSKKPATLTMERTLTFNPDGTYNYKLNTRSATADRVIANGVIIENGAQFNFVAVANKRLPPGTVFTAIDNTAATPIGGTFANLPDDSTITIGRNNFQANYSGGDGNDLTLTVVP